MCVSKLAKNILQYLPVLAMLAAMGAGLFLGKDFYPASLNPSPRTSQGSKSWQMGTSYD